MAKKSTPSTLRRRRWRLNQLEALSQLDLFHGLDGSREGAIADLKAAIAKTTRELGEAEAA